MGKNTFIKEKDKEKEKKKATKTKSSVARFSKIKAIFGNEQAQKIAGLFFLFLAVYMLIAFISHLSTWKSNFLISELSLNRVFTDNSIEITNVTGKLGAKLAFLFINKWFGVSSFFFVFLSFVSGYRLFMQQEIVSVKRSFKQSVFGIVWMSVVMGLLFGPSDLLAGYFGFYSNVYLHAVLGKTGTAFMLLFCLLGFSVVAYDLPIAEWLKNMFESMFSKSTLSDGEVDVNLDDSEEINTANTVVNEEKTVEIEFDDENQAQEKENNGNVDVPEDELDFEIKVNEADEEDNQELADSSEKEEVSIVSEVEEEQNEGESISIEIENEVLEEEEKVADSGALHNTVDTVYDPTLDLPHYKFPKLEFLDDHGGDKISIDRDEVEANKDRIVTTLRNYSIEITKIKATVGPTVTLYEIVPAKGIRISKIKNLEDDIALSLSALGIRIIAPMPGKGTIGIEVPNKKPEIVSMRAVIASEKFANSKMELPIGLGKTISNETFVADLAKMPHLLMAGATGQGKSVGINAIIASLLYIKHPAELKFVLVDPKKVELTLYNKIVRHYLAKLPDSEEAIITDTQKVVRTLSSLVKEMEERYNLLQNAEVRNVVQYNEKFVGRKLNPNNGHRYLPYIVLVVDEFADLMMTAGREVEEPITRLAQLARAVGIHLIIATQRPSVNIITGTIKANFPARVAFRVISKIDSRTILDASGADQLIGRGDMLYSSGSEIVRLQCAFLDTPEVERIAEYIGSQKGYAEAFSLPEVEDESSGESVDMDDADRDAMFEEAARTIVMTQQGSTSMLQRKLKLGYNRAGRIIDQLEAAGVVGHFEGSKAREVLIKDERSLEQLLQRLYGDNSSDIE